LPAHPDDADGRLPVFSLRRPSQLKAFSHPTRARVLEMVIKKAMTSKQLGDALGMSAARVHYHLKFLERAGLIQLVKRRERAGVVEKYYRATSRKYLVSQAIGMFGDPGAVILESLAGAVLSGAETAASGESVGLICGANERVRVPVEKLGELLAVANTLQTAQEQLRELGGHGEEEPPSGSARGAASGQGKGEGPAAGDGLCFELTYALYSAGAAASGGQGPVAARNGDREPGAGRPAGEGEVQDRT